MFFVLTYNVFKDVVGRERAREKRDRERGEKRRGTDKATKPA
jgi:hypothetical protein